MNITGSIHLGAPQAVYLIYTTLFIGGAILLHEKPKEGNYNAVALITFRVLLTVLLFWGGFFGGGS